MFDYLPKPIAVTLHQMKLIQTEFIQRFYCAEYNMVDGLRKFVGYCFTKYILYCFVIHEYDITTLIVHCEPSTISQVTIVCTNLIQFCTFNEIKDK